MKSPVVTHGDARRRGRFAPSVLVAALSLSGSPPGASLTADRTGRFEARPARKRQQRAGRRGRGHAALKVGNGVFFVSHSGCRTRSGR